MIIVWSKCRGNPPVVALGRTKIAQGKGNPPVVALGRTKIAQGKGNHEGLPLQTGSNDDQGQFKLFPGVLNLQFSSG